VLKRSVEPYFARATSLIISKSASGFLGARLAKFPSRVSFGMGVMTVPQMSTTLATASIAAAYGIFSEGLLVSLVVLSIVTITIAPLLIRSIFRREGQEPSRFTKLWRGK
jgi:Kef-type K+ transport system membrane component KefB